MNRRKAGKTIVNCDLPIATDKNIKIYLSESTSH
jgi:hypothetical protein